jgi:hypothetical protein
LPVLRILLGIAAIALAGMVGTIGLIHQVGELGPKVGDMVSFDPLDPISRDMHARLPAMLADDRPGVACVLDVRAMHANGGSVVIEAHERLDQRARSTTCAALLVDGSGRPI